MTGRISRLIDNQQRGTIAADDGREYAFRGTALFQCTFGDLSLGVSVTFEPIVQPKGDLRATAVRLVTK